MRIPEVRYVSFRSTRNFGIELEFNERVPAKDLVRAVSAADPDREVLQSSTYQQDVDNSYWHVKFDRSCSDVPGRGGWEVASYKAHGYADLEVMAKVTDSLKAAGVRVNDDCGFHIHAEIADFKHHQAACMAARWLRIEPTLLEILPKHRRNNKYAKPMSKRFEGTLDAAYHWETFWDRVRPHRFDHPNRRVALNLCNYVQWLPGRRTVELRLPEGTVESKDVRNWIRFYVHFIDTARRQDFPTTLTPTGVADTLRLAGLHGDSPFLLLSKGLRETKMWFINRILQYSAKAALRAEAAALLEKMEVPAASDPEPKPPRKGPALDPRSRVWWRRQAVA